MAPRQQPSGTPDGDNDFTVLICTRERQEMLAHALDALARSTSRRFPVVVVDHSRALDEQLARRAAAAPDLLVLRDEGGTGLSRARNLAMPHIATEWVVLLDDDCSFEPGWVEALEAAWRLHPQVDLIAGNLEGHAPDEGDYLLVTTFKVAEERLRSGRWTPPADIGFTACCAIRRSTIERLAGWDERLGAGAPVFPASEDMDFNYRFLISGGVALATPQVQVHHHQWRTSDDLGSHFLGYMKGWSGFSMKQLRGGDVLGGCWLWSIGALDVSRMFASALRRRSRFRLRVALDKLRGLVSGTLKGLTYPW